MKFADAGNKRRYERRDWIDRTPSEVILIFLFFKSVDLPLCCMLDTSLGPMHLSILEASWVARFLALSLRTAKTEQELLTTVYPYACFAHSGWSPETKPTDFKEVYCMKITCLSLAAQRSDPGYTSLTSQKPTCRPWCMR